MIQSHQCVRMYVYTHVHMGTHEEPQVGTFTCQAFCWALGPGARHQASE